MDKISIYKKMIDDNPSNGYAWYLIGVEYSEQGNYSETLKAFSEALKYCDDELKGKILLEIGNLSSNIGKKENSSQPEEDDEISNEELELENNEENNENEYINSGNNIIPLRVIGGSNKNSKSSPDINKEKVTFSDIGGLDDLKETIKMKIIKPFINPGLFDKFKKKVGGGILLYGPPGCGKTYIAKATAGECNSNFIPVHITDILDPYLGVSAQNIKDIFSTARSKKPCVLFFDEIDTIGFSRSKLSSEHMRPIVDQMLSEIEGIDSNTDKLLIIGATNMPWDVDSAFKRPGRFDKTIFVAPPDAAARRAIFKLKISGRPVEELDYNIIANRTELYSGADIENVIEIATENVIAEILKTGVERQIQMTDILAAIEVTKPSTVEWLRTVKNYVKYANQSGLYNDVESFLAQYKKIL